jgi:hypothetical protein
MQVIRASHVLGLQRWRLGDHRTCARRPRAIPAGDMSSQIQGDCVDRDETMYIIILPLHSTCKIRPPIPILRRDSAKARPIFLGEHAREQVLARPIQGHKVPQAGVQNCVDPVVHLHKGEIVRRCKESIVIGLTVILAWRRVWPEMRSPFSRSTETNLIWHLQHSAQSHQCRPGGCCDAPSLFWKRGVSCLSTKVCVWDKHLNMKNEMGRYNLLPPSGRRAAPLCPPWTESF